MQTCTMIAWHPWRPPSPLGGEQLARATVRAVWDLHSFYKEAGNDEQWLWRGQANAGHGLEPAIHTRVKRAKDLTDANVIAATLGLVRATRRAKLSVHEATDLPDLSLLAMLQHHGAATPLLDVTLDPVVALYMAVVSNNPDDGGRDGIIFAIKRPTVAQPEKFDSRRFSEIYKSLPAAGVVAYISPDVSERLRIQRGLFLLSKVHVSDYGTMPLSFETDTDTARHWVSERINTVTAGRPATTKTDVAVFIIPHETKPRLQKWLEARSGMTKDFVYPTRWHQPHFEQFAHSHGRQCVL